MDTDGLIAHWNAGAGRLLGWSAAEAIGQSLDLMVPAEHRADRAQTSPDPR